MKRSSFKGVKYGCTEYAVEILTGRNLLKETGLKPEQVGFDHVEKLTGGQCKIKNGSSLDMINGKLDTTMLRIVPSGQKEEHTVIL